MIELGNPKLSVRRQCTLLSLNRSSYYYEPCQETELNQKLMRLIDEKHLERPYFGRRKMAEWLVKEGYDVNYKRVGRLMQKLCIEGITPGPKTSKPSKEHVKYPYLLKNLCINRVNHVWGTDITYIPVASGYLYLVAVMDWYSRYVLAWKLSNTLDSDFCIQALKEALKLDKPEIFNSDQGVQFTSGKFTEVLKAKNIQISMDGKGRALDNIYVERLWRTVKYEEVYLKSYEDGEMAYGELKNYLKFYNEERQHQALKYMTPREVFSSRELIPGNEIMMR